MGQVKKRGLILLLAAALLGGPGSFCSEAFTVTLAPTSFENFADVVAIYDGSQIGPVTSTSKPFALAALYGDARAPGLWAYNGRGIKSEVIRNEYLTEQGLIWSEAVIGFGGESAYVHPSTSPSIFDGVVGNSNSSVSYELSFQGQATSAEAYFSVFYYNNYPQPLPTGWDVSDSIILKDRNKTELFNWPGAPNLILDYKLNLVPGEIYTLHIDSKGEFPFSGGNAGGPYLSMGELKIRVSEQVAIPAPDSLVLLVSALGGWLALRKRIALWR